MIEGIRLLGHLRYIVMKKEYDIKVIIEGAYYPGVYIIKIKKILNERIQYSDFKEVGIL